MRRVNDIVYGRRVLVIRNIVESCSHREPIVAPTQFAFEMEIQVEVDWKPERVNRSNDLAAFVLH
jgi:hypothetical protein